MSTFSNNHTSGMIDPLVMNQIRETFQNLNNLLPFLVATDALHNGLLPPTINSMELSKELPPFNHLNEMLRLSQQLTEKILDTQILASEAHLSALGKENAASDLLDN